MTIARGNHDRAAIRDAIDDGEGTVELRVSLPKRLHAACLMLSRMNHQKLSPTVVSLVSEAIRDKIKDILKDFEADYE